MQMKNEKQRPIPQLTAVFISPCATWAKGPKAFARAAEKHDPSTRTIPDDSFTIGELFNRYQKGQPLPLGIERPIQYGDSPTHNDLDIGRISRLDLVEVNDLKKRVSDTYIALEARQKALKAQSESPRSETPVTPAIEPSKG